MLRLLDDESRLNPTRDDGWRRYQAMAPAAGRAQEATCGISLLGINNQDLRV